LGLVPNEDENLVDLILEKESELSYNKRAQEIEAQNLSMENIFL
jgi:hypothetical protein